MKTLFLFPPGFKKAGWFLLIPGLVLGILNLYFGYRISWLDTGTATTQVFDFTDHNLTNELAAIMLMLGLMLIAFSRRPDEDEFIGHMRHNALLWAVYANTLIVMLCIVFIYGGSFMSVLIYNLFTIPVIYLLRFQYLLYRSTRDNQAGL